MFVVSVLQAASSLAPSDKYHRNPQGGHRHATTSGGETNRSSSTNSAVNNNNQFSHNGLTTASLQQGQQQQHHHEEEQQPLLNPVNSPYHFYPGSVGSSSITSSSHQFIQHQPLQHHHHHQQHYQQGQPPPFLYKSNHSHSSGSGGSGNGSHIIIDGSASNGGSVEGSNNKYYYYNSSYYQHPTEVQEEGGEVEDPDQIFTITAQTTESAAKRMGRVGEDMYPPGSPASIGSGTVGGSGLFKSKSGSIPVSSNPRGFRDTFISSMSPPAHAHSAESSPLHRSASATTANRDSERFSSANNNIKQGEPNKKWTFGGLFRRNKSKAGGVSSSGPSANISNNSVIENGAGGGASVNNSNSNSPAKVNNNYGGLGSGSPVVVARQNYSPAPSSSLGGFVSVDPSVGHSDTVANNTSKFVNAEVQTRAKGKLSESDISTCDSDFELSHHHENPPEPAPQDNKGYKQNFLVRRLSRRREKAAAKKAAATAAAAPSSSVSATNTPAHAPKHDNNSSTNGFISSQHGYLDVPQMKRRVGSSPDSLNNSSEPWPSWETTKKPQTQLQVLQQQQRLNYSSNGSLSLSQDGSNNNNQGGSNGSRRAAVKDAVKARAIARRESFLRDSSSSDDDEDPEERSRSSLQGSFSSLNSRNRRQRAFNMQQVQFQQQRHLFPATTGGGGGSCASPSSPMPVPLDYRNSMSPNMNRRLMMMGAPGSPKWEARVIYQQENITENNQPVVFRLPRKERSGAVAAAAATTTSNPSQMSQANGDQSFILATEMISEDQHVVTAGLKVPFLPVQNPSQQQQQQYPVQDQQCFRNGQLMYPDDPVQYANVANGMRGRSATPYTFNNTNTPGGVVGGAIHHASATPPPPPPPRRDFSRATNNPNFYRPMSCSYLDSYASQQLQHHHHQQQQLSEQQQQQQQQLMRQQSPMLFNNGNYIYPHHQYQGQEMAMNGFASHSNTPVQMEQQPTPGVRSSPRHLAASGRNTAQDVTDSRHPPLIRSPSEPPAIRIEGAHHHHRNSPVKRLVSSPMPNGNSNENKMEMGSNNPSPNGGGGKNPITSKLGFPVRRLQEASKLTGPQSPVHLRASEFWRKKESEVTGTSPVGANNQKKYLNRIRSADSSPLPVPKMRKSPGVVASNESISSLSSFSENAASPGPPKNSSSPINPGKQQGSSATTTTTAVKVHPIRAQISKTPNPQQLTYGNNNKDKENNNMQATQQSAVERLKVRIPSAPDGIKSSHNNPNGSSSASAFTAPDNSNKAESANNPIRALIELNNGKTPGKNLEDALNELEDMYKSLRLSSDEDLLDRAERRDLPTRHQELRNAPLIPIPQAYRFEHLGSVESLGTGSGSSGTNYTAHSAENISGGAHRVRAPPVRRSSRPDTVSDDMANRRLAFPDGKPLDPRLVVAKTGSYLARSPAFSPCTSPCPQDGYSLAFLGQEEPDLTLDDVTFRNYKRANSIRLIDPQPLFGIPLGPITAAAATDYLHSKPKESYRPIFGHLKTPDIVNDDIAFRNLRKDLGADNSLNGTKDWTPRLFSPNRETAFNYPNVKDNKKLRAIRSLSANITHMIPGGNESGSTTPARDSSYFQQGRDIGNKWNSFSDLHSRRASAGSPVRASTYLQPSWVEQIEKFGVQTSTETLTDHRNSSCRFSTAILEPPEQFPKKFPNKTVELTPPIYDPGKQRRPWTDIILESFEKDEQKELEQMGEDEEGANEAALANNKTGAKTELLEAAEEVDVEDDDDVFIDASEEASKSGALQTHGSKNNDPFSQQQTRPNMESSSATAAALLARPLPLLPGQKTRRGSWVEPSYTSRSFSSSTAFQASQSSPMDPSQGDPILQDKRRKSWSDLPKDIDSYSSAPIILVGSSSSSSGSPTRKLFNPLPPPKKIRQINLEAFNNNSSVGTLGDSSSVKQQRNNRAEDDEGNSQMTSSSCESTAHTTNKIKGEDELNELMDQLLKDADTCGQSSRDEKRNAKKKADEKDLGELKTDVKEPSNFSAVSSSSSPPLPSSASKDKSISETENSQEGEMEMDGRTSSSEKSCKQDLSCTIVGIIPKHQSQQTSAERNNRNAQPNFSQQQQQAATTSSTPLKSLPSSPPPSSEIDSRGSQKVLKTDNNGKGAVDGANTPIKEFSTGKSASLSCSKKVGSAVASSIEDLIESISESLPELEASCGVGILRVTHSDGKPNGSSSSSGSPASSIPSPSPGSPTPPVLSVSVKKEMTTDMAESGPLSPSVFPVPAKRHHLPSKVAEESLYENLPARRIAGNDEKVSSPSSTTGPNHHRKQGGDDPCRFSNSEKIPPLTRSLHDTHNDEADVDDDVDEDEEPAQHSSSHQPSSLSSNDSSEVSGSSPREDRAANNINDNNKDKVGQTTSSSSIPFDKTTYSSSSFDAFAKNSSDNNTTATTNPSGSGNNKNCSGSSGEMLMRKKSEGSFHGLSSERDDYIKTGVSPETSMILIVDPPLAKRGSEFILSQDESFVNPERETYITSSSTSSSSVEDANQKTKKKEQPVAGVCSTFSCTTTSTTTDKKCAPSQPTSTAAAVVETSASETTSAGMSFLRNNFPFFRNSTSRSRSQSVVSDVSRSSETGDSKREKDKSYRRKSHLNRAFTDEPVPDNNYSLDHTPKSSKAPSQDPSSMENSAVEESRTKPAVKLHPVIPPVLTGKSGSPSLKPLSRNSSNKNFESTPSPVPTNSVMGKTQAEQNRKSTPVVKKDSFSDAEGVCFIKKMLQKESDRDRAAAAAARQNPHSSTTGNGSSGGYNIKKSPSAGNQSYWSKFSSSQPAFLRKLFEKPKISESPLNLKTTQKNSSNENSQSGESHEKDSEKENAEPAMGFSVAQKASFFMKLEHEQRFSRWRKNSVDFSSGTNITEQQPTQLNGVVNGMGVATNNVRETRPRSRYLTQPVTPTEVKELAPLVNLSALKLEGQDRNLEFGSQPRIWGNSYTSLGNFIADSSEKMSNDIDEPSHIPKSSYKDCDNPHKFEPIILGSLKERVNKFDEIVTRKLEPMQCSAAPTPTVKSYSLTRSSRNNNHINDTNNHLGGGFPMYHSASAIINTPAKTTAKPTANFYKYAAAAYSSSSSSFSEAVSRNDSTKFLPAAANKAHCKESYQSAAVDGNKRRSSVSEVELSAKTANRSPLVSRSEKVRSLFISGGGSHYDAETLSEDGEVSSGGQEVAEIICRSYENSPVFRKKTWRTQKQAVQTNFSKEIWRRCGNYENWNNRSYTNPPQQPQHPVPQTFTATTNVIEITTAAPPTIAPVSESPPMTSNLLQILTVLSSSNDELSESKPKSKKQRQGHNKQVAPRSDSDSIPPVHPGHQNHSTSTNTAMAPVPTSSEIFVSVPHPEDEAFQSFFCSVKSYTKVTHFPPGVMQNHLDTNGQLQQQRYETNSVNGGTSHSAIGIDTPNEVLDISSVRRESDLLVMKKNVPTAKRKSSGKYKNPLRALAARMDFRQQGYTQSNNKAVQCSSDVDVTT